ncbi:MAG: homoserine dehydrogenase [Calditrichaeota bacterium]|nr:homoserine dehydrogenase [Calditrichota bacterium]
MTTRLLIVGFGNVGRGLARLLISRSQWLKTAEQLDCRVISITDLRYGTIVQPEGISLEPVLQHIEQGTPFSTQPQPTENLIRQLDYDVLIELTPTRLETGEPAHSYIRMALERGRHVITTNKGPVAHHLLELERLAREKGVHFRYEGTVLAGTPLINLIRNHLAGATIHKIEGIVNGTCNYILTRMAAGMDYTAALKDAQEKGYAEADPTADVEAWDAVAKVMILAQVAFGQKLPLHSISRQGISGLTVADIQQALREGHHWRLIATLQQQDGILEASVAPQKIPQDHPFASVTGATNAIAIYTDCLSRITITGPGAGPVETGFAVLNDLIHIHRKITRTPNGNHNPR